MAIKRTTNKNKKTKNKRKPNWLLRFTILVIVIPLAILAWVLLTSIENTGEPVTGDRFDSQLNPAITDEQLKALKTNLAHGQIQSIEVNLKSATLRITMDANDDLDQATITQIMEDMYGRVNATLPIETYFTNTEDTKMYDLEIHIFNIIPEDPKTQPYVHLVRTKTGAGAVSDSLPSAQKVPELVVEILK